MIKKIFKGILIFLVSLIILIGIGDFLWINLPKLSARKNISDIEDYGNEVSEINLDDNVRLVGLGEATHGNADFQDFQKLENTILSAQRKTALRDTYGNTYWYYYQYE